MFWVQVRCNVASLMTYINSICHAIKSDHAKKYNKKDDVLFDTYRFIRDTKSGSLNTTSNNVARLANGADLIWCSFGIFDSNLKILYIRRLALKMSDIRVWRIFTCSYIL